MQIVINFLLAINVIVALLIILLVLMQRPKNEGLGAAFGGGMTENLFGAQTSNVLQTITRWLGAMFFGFTLLVSWLMVKKDFNRSSLQQRLSAPTVIPATPVPVIPKDVPTSLPEAASAPVKPAEAPKAPELEKTPAAPAPEAAKPAPAAPAPAPPPEAAKPESAPAPAPEAAKPAPAPEAAKPAPVPAAEPAKPADAAPAPAPEAPKP
jgi:protein translocase SecG subunit